MDWSLIVSKIKQALRIFIDYPGLDIVIAIALFFYVIWTMRDRKSSSGVWFIMVIAVIFFMMGMGGLTGLGLGMSF